MTTNANPVRILPPTAATCPEWCSLRAGHSFDQLDGDGSEVRQHVRIHGSPKAFSADVVQLVRWKEGAEEPIEPIAIQVWIAGNTGDDLITTPEGARRLAAYLMDAADTLEEIQGGHR